MLPWKRYLRYPPVNGFRIELRSWFAPLGSG